MRFPELNSVQISGHHSFLNSVTVAYINHEFPCMQCRKWDTPFLLRNQTIRNTEPERCVSQFLLLQNGITSRRCCQSYLDMMTLLWRIMVISFQQSIFRRYIHDKGSEISEWEEFTKLRPPSSTDLSWKVDRYAPCTAKLCILMRLQMQIGRENYQTESYWHHHWRNHHHHYHCYCPCCWTELPIFSRNLLPRTYFLKKAADHKQKLVTIYQTIWRHISDECNPPHSTGKSSGRVLGLLSGASGFASRWGHRLFCK
jgi:hypothetical protein